MNTKCIVRWLCAAVSCVAMLASTACSKVDHSLLDTVPANATVVGVADVELIFKRAGSQIDGGVIQLSPELRQQSDVFQSQILSAFGVFADLYGAIDLSDVVVVSSSNQGIYYTFMVSDSGAAADKMTSYGAVHTTDGDCEIYTGDEWTLAMRNAQGWLINADTEISEVIETIDPKESIASQLGIVDFLNGDNAMNLAILTDGLGDKADAEGTRACVSVKIEESVIGMRMQLISPDGKVSKFASDYQKINTAFLNYVPESYVAAAAIGLSPSFDWSVLGTAAAMFGGRDVAAMTQMAIPFLSKIDGTVAVAAGPAGGAPAIADVNLQTWNFLVMAHMPQSDADAILSQLGMMASQFGVRSITPESSPEGISAWQLPDGTEIYAGNVDGCLALSNREFSADGENSMTDTFLSMRAAAAVNIPAGSEIVKAFNLPWGFNLSVQVAESEAHVRFSLNGTDRSVLQALLAQL